MHMCTYKSKTKPNQKEWHSYKFASNKTKNKKNEQLCIELLVADFAYCLHRYA